MQYIRIRDTSYAKLNKCIGILGDTSVKIAETSNNNMQMLCNQRTLKLNVSLKILYINRNNRSSFLKKLMEK